MSSTIRIDGIYDRQYLDILVRDDIKSFTLDFRPKSFNFLQHHGFLKILQEIKSQACQIFLHFDQSPDYVVQKFIDDGKSILGAYPYAQVEMVIEFSDARDTAFYDQFHWPFVWHWHPLADFEEILEAKYLRGVVFSYEHILKIYAQGRFDDFYKNICSRFIPQLKKNNCLIILTIDWAQEILPSVLEFMGIDIFSYPLNQQVEISYRVPNVALIKEKLESIRQLIIC